MPRKQKETVTESFEWTVSCDISANSQEELEKIVEGIESNLDDAWEVELPNGGEISDYTVKM